MEVLNKKKIFSGLFAVSMLGTAFSSYVPATVKAANTNYITEIALAVGADSYDVLDQAGYSTMFAGLNSVDESEKQIHIGYKYNTGAPITDIIIKENTGDIFTTPEGISYSLVSDIDVEAENGEGGGCLYVSHDEDAGAPLVGLDILKADSEEKEELLAIPNDGAEVVKNEAGTPADLEKNSQTVTIYLAKIRDHLVKPFISEVAPVEDTDRWNAVYTAMERGYNYFIDADIDNSTDTYTILAYNRTANVDEAIRNIRAVSADVVSKLEDSMKNAPEEEVKASLITIGSADYQRTASLAVRADVPYYLYTTLDKEEGNPMTMLYVGDEGNYTESLLGTWSMSYFTARGTTSAYSFIMNEDSLSSLQGNTHILTEVPVTLVTNALITERPTAVTTAVTTAAATAATEETLTELPTEETSGEQTEVPESEEQSELLSEEAVEETVSESFMEEVSEEADSETAADLVTEAETEVTEEAEILSETEMPTDIITETAVSETAAETETGVSTSELSTEATGSILYVPIIMLTFKEGLSADKTAFVSGMKEVTGDTPVLERNERSDRQNKNTGSAISETNVLMIMLITFAALVIAGAGVAMVKLRKLRREKATGKRAENKAEKLKAKKEKKEKKNRSKQDKRSKVKKSEDNKTGK